jgi:sugar (pentulose or hexulose) kinase
VTGTGPSVVIGIDVGTSGVRVLAVAPDRRVVAGGKALFDDLGSDRRAPELWWRALSQALNVTLAGLGKTRVRALAVDGTSGTVVPVAADGTPLARPMMYNDPVGDTEIVARIGRTAPAASAAHGATSGLAKALVFRTLPGVRRIVHQADWLAGRFLGRFDLSDANNALKTGYDPVSETWPEWVAAVGMDIALLPSVAAPGSIQGRICRSAAETFGLPEDVLVVAGTTDGCASFLATGADKPGDGVTALGTTLTIKMLTIAPIFAPEYGIYSHRLGDVWLAGGASNTGGGVLARHFDGARIAALSAAIDPSVASGLDYYPLPKAGERFPVNDPDFAPRMTPRPADDAEFLKGLLEGMASIESRAYGCLSELGAPPLRSLRTVGGGAANPAWTAIRQRLLPVPFLPPLSEEAAFGAALLALQGAVSAGAIEQRDD